MANITQASVIADIEAYIVAPAQARATYYLGYAPSYTNTSVLAGQAITRPATAAFSGNITTNPIVNAMIAYAKFTTVVRSGLSGLYNTNDGSAWYSNQQVNLFRFIDSYQAFDISAASLSNKPITGDIAYLSNIRSLYTQLRNIAIGSEAYQVDLRVCHSSCHDDCHASRGRR